MSPTRGGRRPAVGADVLLVVAVGGALGSLARWGLAMALPRRAGAFPWATFITNLTGCLLLGALMVLVHDVWPPSRYRRPFLGVGVLGGFTTFSTYLLDSRALMATGQQVLAAAYLLGSVGAGLAAVWAGAATVRLALGARGHSGRGTPSESSSTASEASSTASGASSAASRDPVSRAPLAGPERTSSLRRSR